MRSSYPVSMLLSLRPNLTASGWRGGTAAKEKAAGFSRCYSTGIQAARIFQAAAPPVHAPLSIQGTGAGSVDIYTPTVGAGFPVISRKQPG